MDPWTVLGWILVGLLSLVVIAILAVVVFLCISVSLYLRDKKVEVAEKERHEVEIGLRVQEVDPQLGKIFMIGEKAFKVIELENEYLPERDQLRWRVTFGEI